MRRLRPRLARSRLSVVLTCLVPIGLAVALSGCATSSAADRTGATSDVPKAARTTTGGTVTPPATGSTPQGERHQTDDPYGLYSPLYGLWASLRPPGTGRWSAAEEDAIIAQAITAHEMRRP